MPKLKRGQKYSVKDLLKAQDADSLLQAVKMLLEDKEAKLAGFPKSVARRAKRYWRGRKSRIYLNDQGVLCCRRKNSERNLYANDRIVLPQLYQAEVMRLAHHDMGHQGIQKVSQRVLQRFEWPGLFDSIAKWIATCDVCQQARKPYGHTNFPMKSVKSRRFNELIQMDHLKVSRTKRGNTHILVIIDHFSKLAEAVPCSEDTAKETCDWLIQRWFSRYGTPAYIQSDNGTQFTAELTRCFIEAGYSLQVFSTPEHPRTNALVERQNRTPLNLLKVFHSRHIVDWDEMLDEVTGVYNATVQASTGVTPYQILTGKEKTTPLGYCISRNSCRRNFVPKQDYVNDTLRRQQEIHELVRHNTGQAQRRQRKVFRSTVETVTGLSSGRLSLGFH